MDAVKETKKRDKNFGFNTTRLVWVRGESAYNLNALVRFITACGALFKHKASRSLKANSAVIGEGEGVPGIVRVFCMCILCSQKNSRVSGREGV